MKSSKKLQAFRALLIVALVSVIILLALALLLPVIAKDVYPNYLAYVKDVARATVGVIVFPFMKGSSFANYLSGIYETGLGVNPLIISITGYVVAGLTLIFIVVACIHFISKKKARNILYVLLLFALIGYSLILLGYGPLYFLNIKNLIQKVTGYTAAGIVSIVLFVFALFAFLATYINLFILMSLASEKAAEENAEESNEINEEERPVLPDEAVAEEVGEVPSEAASDEQVAPAIMQEYTPTYVPEVEPEPTEEEEIVEEKEEPVIIAEPIPEPDDNAKTNHMEVNINTAPQQTPNAFDQTSFTAMIKDMLREIVRDEIARNQASQPQKEPQPIESGDRTITGATFGGPLVVQYFNGGINGVNPEARVEPAPAPAKQEEKPVEEAPKEEKPVEEAPKEEAPASEPAPAPVAAAPAPEEEKEKVVYERLSFGERLLQSDKELHAIYNELKNEILSYGVKSRISANGDTFRLHKKMYVRITVAGKSLKLYFALNPDDYKDSKIPVQDAGHKGLYADIPLVFKVRSPLSIKRAKELIQDCMDKDGLEQGEVGKVNWIKELRVEVNEAKKRKESNAEDDD